MKRINGLFNKIISIDNLNLADINARKGKAKSIGVIIYDKNREQNIWNLHLALKDKTFKTSKYNTFKIFDKKERIISSLPYYPDRIVHHAIIYVLEPIFIRVFTKDTYSCIKGRGIHGAAKSVKQALKDVENTKYCLKLDIKKFYPSINHVVLKSILRRKIKDNDLLWLLDEIIDSTSGLPLGNYTSQWLANLYLAYFDHWIKETKMVKYYFRYADDVVIFSNDKKELHLLLVDIREYIEKQLLLEIKKNYQIFPVAARGVDFVGYKFYHTHTLLRKSIKQNFIRMMKYNPNLKSFASYNGWVKHCDGKHLMKKYGKAIL